MLIRFEVEEEVFVLQTTASILDETMPGHWPTFNQDLLHICVLTILKTKIWLGPVSSPEDPEEFIRARAAEGWYVFGACEQSVSALEGFRLRYPTTSAGVH